MYSLDELGQVQAFESFSEAFPFLADDAQEYRAFLRSIKGHKSEIVHEKLQALRASSEEKYAFMLDVIITIRPGYDAKLQRYVNIKS